MIQRARAMADSARVAGRFHARRWSRRLRLGTSRPRIVFLAQDPTDWWSMHALYEACASDPRLDAVVLNVGFGPWQGMTTDCGEVFAALGITAVDGHDSPDLLRRLRPDVLVLSNPYDVHRPAAYHSTHLAAITRILYVTYGFDVGGAGGRMTDFQLGQPTQRRAWRIVASDAEHAELWHEWTGMPRRRILATGLPLFDLPPVCPGRTGLPADVLAHAGHRRRVLYTPHHTLDEWSTFLTNGPVMRQLLERHDRMFVVFRPHPGLSRSLVDASVMNGEDLRRYFHADRSHFDDPHTTDLLAVQSAADILVTDASSSLFLFARTRRPIVYLEKPEGAGLDRVAQRFVDQYCYVARSASDLEATIDALLEGDDPLAMRRSHWDGSFWKPGAAARLHAYLVRATT